MLVASIREACLKILREEGHEQLTTQRIADVAGVNIASVYQYFPNKEAILAGIYDERLEHLAKTREQEFRSVMSLSRRSLEDTLRYIIEVEADQLLELYTLSPDFYRQYSHSYDIHRRVDEITKSYNNPPWREWFPTFLHDHRELIRDHDLQLMSFITRSTLLGNIQAALQEDPALLQQPSFREELLHCLLQYLKPSNPASSQ
jgi:AcrR family transcriptional regulator